jgi:glutamine synthetase
MGHASAKDQQLDDHYFGSIPERVMAFMHNLESGSLQAGDTRDHQAQRGGSQPV